MIDRFSDEKGNDPTRSRDLGCEFAAGAVFGSIIATPVASLALSIANGVGPGKAILYTAGATAVAVVSGSLAGAMELASAIPDKDKPVLIPEQPRPVTKKLGLGLGIVMPFALAAGVYFTSDHEPVAVPNPTSTNGSISDKASCNSQSDLAPRINCT